MSKRRAAEMTGQDAPAHEAKRCCRRPCEETYAEAIVNYAVFHRLGWVLYGSVDKMENVRRAEMPLVRFRGKLYYGIPPGYPGFDTLYQNPQTKRAVKIDGDYWHATSLSRPLLRRQLLVDKDFGLRVYWWAQDSFRLNQRRVTRHALAHPDHLGAAIISSIPYLLKFVEEVDDYEAAKPDPRFAQAAQLQTYQPYAAP